jgi:hypothetical protein
MSYQPPTNYNNGWPGGYQTPRYEPPNGNIAMPPSNYPPMTPGYPPPMGANSLYAPVAALPQQDQRRGLALAGFILSLLSIVFFLGLFIGGRGTGEGLIWFSGVILAVIGIILSALGRRSVSRKGLAITGLVLSIITLCLLVAIMIIGLIVLASHSA